MKWKEKELSYCVSINIVGKTRKPNIRFILINVFTPIRTK